MQNKNNNKMETSVSKIKSVKMQVPFSCFATSISLYSTLWEKEFEMKKTNEKKNRVENAIFSVIQWAFGMIPSICNDLVRYYH